MCHLQIKTVLLFHSYRDTFYFFLLFAMAGTFTMLNRSGNDGHPLFAPKLRGIVFSLPPLNVVLAVGSS